MKLMKKILVSAIAISAIAAFNAVAFAEDEATATPEPVVPAATYDATAKTITLSGFEVANDQKTLLILNADVDQFDDTTAKAEAEGGAIVQIDQSTAMNGVAIPVGERTPGSKVWIRVGGDDTGFIELEYEIPGAGGDTVTVGDVNDDGELTSDDATEILCATVDLESVIVTNPANNAYYAGAYCNGDAELTSDDATEILCATVDLEHHANINTDVEIGSIQ